MPLTPEPPRPLRQQNAGRPKPLPPPGTRAPQNQPPVHHHYNRSLHGSRGLTRKELRRHQPDHPPVQQKEDRLGPLCAQRPAPRRTWTPGLRRTDPPYPQPAPTTTNSEGEAPATTPFRGRHGAPANTLQRQGRPQRSRGASRLEQAFIDQCRTRRRIPDQTPRLSVDRHHQLGGPSGPSPPSLPTDSIRTTTERRTHKGKASLTLYQGHAHVRWGVAMYLEREWCPLRSAA